ncbi:AcrB/AcrD/AcrF family protein [candidate division GN15 bacterium]|uniref:AcrB/AcrD/AcrF family protein n=1 Tax=candidate division GN15 bacterium TaxID=2072418 RepID=A0A855WUL8_9BACT|nr:MAG: AcrB/AcrD/AcrF family protein [candidate division GN15 bacterium]
MKLSEVAIKRPVFTTMMMGALLVLGLFSLLGLPVEQFPNIDFPFVIVQTVMKGASAESMENDVSKKIEDAVNQISGVRNIQSTSQEGYSLVVIEFELEKKSYEASNDVREKVAGIRADLPTEIEEPIVSTWDPGAQPILYIAVSGQRTPKEITEFTKNFIKKRLETVSGVGSVQLIGGSEREINVFLNPDKMEAFGLTVDDIQNGLMAGNVEIPGGRVDETSREYLLRVKGRVDRVSQLNDIIVKNRKGTQIRLSDVATVADTTVEQRSLSRYKGQTAVSLGIARQSGANVVEIASRTKDVIEQLKKELPPDIKMEIVSDNSTYIQDSIHEVEFNIEFGMLLAIIVIFLFLLDIRPTIITGLSIPISLVATFTIMKALGFTVNMMTLMGLSLSVGILIDDAIVVIENIYRHIHEGRSPWEAAFTATKEIGLAVMATTFSIVVVFVPVAFMQGIVGRFFYQFGMTVAFAVTISLFVAFTLTPMLSARWLVERTERIKKSGFAGTLQSIWAPIEHLLSYWNRGFDWLKPVYLRLLRSALNHRVLVILIAAASFVAALFAAQFVGQEFMAQSDEGKVYVTVDTPPGTTLQETSDRIQQIEDIVNKLPEVAASYVTIGRGNDPVTSGQVLFNLVDASKRKIKAQALVDSVRTLIQQVPGVKVSCSAGEGHAGGGKSVEVSIRGENLDELTRLRRQVQGIANAAPGAVDVDNTQEEGKPELQVTVDRKQADDLGLSLYTIPMTVRALVEGNVVTRYKEGSEEYDVRVRLDSRFRSTAEDIGRILVKSNKEIPGRDPYLVPLNQVARVVKADVIGRYQRYNRQREVRVNANVLSTAFAGSVSNYVMQKAAEIELPPGYVIAPVGEAEIMAESFANILQSLILAIIFIYLLLASQYESFTDPFSIMLSLPLSLVGAILALIGSSFSIMSMIGIVMLMGLVTKNAILLVDFVKQKRAQGMDRTGAILEAGPIRLRPILMTTFAMVFGMLPVALGIGPGAEFRAPMARAVIGGIISSTLLTLVVVPVVYTIIDDFAGLFRRKRKPGTNENEGIVVH